MPRSRTRFARFSARLGICLTLLLASQLLLPASTLRPADLTQAAPPPQSSTAGELCDYFEEAMQAYNFLGARTGKGFDYCSWSKPGDTFDTWHVEVFSYPEAMISAQAYNDNISLIQSHNGPEELPYRDYESLPGIGEGAFGAKFMADIVNTENNTKTLVFSYYHMVFYRVCYKVNLYSQHENYSELSPLAVKIDDVLKKMPPCIYQSFEDESGAFSTEGGCEYHGESEWVCAATAVNAPENAILYYTWYLDGKKQEGEIYDQISLDEKKIGSGRHTIMAEAMDKRSGKTASAFESAILVKEASDSDFTVTMKSCNYDDTNASFTCTCTANNPPKDETLQYIWEVWGQTQTTASPTFTKKVPAGMDTFLVSVQAQAGDKRLTRQASSYVLISHGTGGKKITQPEDGQLFMEYPGGPQGMYAIDPGVSITLQLAQQTLMEVDIKIKCAGAERSLLSLKTLAQDDQAAQTLIKLLVKTLADCAKLKSQGAPLYAIGGLLPGLTFAASDHGYAQQASPAARVDVELLQGELQSRVREKQVELTIQTETTYVRTGQENIFNVSVEPSLKTTAVEALSGPLDVLPKSLVLKPLTLQAGERTVVKVNEIGEPTANFGNPSAIYYYFANNLIYGCICLALPVLLVGAAAGIGWRMRRRLNDLNSINGTYLDGARINQAALLPGALIQIGAVRLEFRAREEG